MKSIESSRKMRPLDAGYASQVDQVAEAAWHGLLRLFADANTYQTWPYGEVISGQSNLSHLILKYDGEVAAIAQARIAKAPFINFGIAYIQWGPIWRRSAASANLEAFRQAVRALRNEYVCKRGLSLRLFPVLFDDSSLCFSQILAEEGFSSLGEDLRGRTILMDLQPPLTALREGMARNWKRNLRQAEQNELETIEGTTDELFERFIPIYKQMVTRKNFVEPNNIHQFKSIQARLPEQFKMKIMLCRSGGETCAGLIWSQMGKMGIELFAATSDAGMQNKGSYLLRWKIVEKLKQSGAAVYNLNGINPAANPGGFKFKSELAGKNGKDVRYVGRFDSHAGVVTRCCIEFGDTLRTTYRSLKERMKHVRSAKSSLKAGQPEQEPSGLANPPELSQVRQMYSRGRMTAELTPGGIRGKV
ncbi:MAG: GNAT family N-acetyltransferase [Candidatus Sulfotelmatobacter sp.]